MLLIVPWTPQTRAGIISLVVTAFLTFTELPLTTASRNTLERLSRALQALEDMVTEPWPCARCCGGERRVLTLEELRGDVRGLLRQGVSSRDLLRTVVWELYTMNSASVVQPSFNEFYNEMRTKLGPFNKVRPDTSDHQSLDGKDSPDPSQERSVDSRNRLQGSTNCHTLPTQRLEPRRNSATREEEIQIHGIQTGTRDGRKKSRNTGQHSLSTGRLALTRISPPVLRPRPPGESSKQHNEEDPGGVIINDRERVRPGVLSPSGPSPMDIDGKPGPQVEGIGDSVNDRPVSTPSRHCANRTLQSTPTYPAFTKSSLVTGPSSTRHRPPSSKEKHILPMMILSRDGSPDRGVGSLPPKPAPLEVIIIDPRASDGVPKSYTQRVTVEPSSGVYDILRKASLEYEMRAENEFKKNPFTFQLGRFRSTCYILKSVFGWSVTTEDYWTITVEDSDRQVLFEDICIPNKHHLPMRPGYTIYLDYTSLPDARRANTQPDKQISPGQ